MCRGLLVGRLGKHVNSSIHVYVRSALVIQGGWSVHPYFPGQSAIADWVTGYAVAVNGAGQSLGALNLKRMSIHIVCELIGMPTHHVDRWVSLSTCKAWPRKNVVINSTRSERPLDGVQI